MRRRRPRRVLRRLRAARIRGEATGVGCLDEVGVKRRRKSKGGAVNAAAAAGSNKGRQTIKADEMQPVEQAGSLVQTTALIFLLLL